MASTNGIVTYNMLRRLARIAREQGNMELNRAYWQQIRANANRPRRSPFVPRRNGS